MGDLQIIVERLRTLNIEEDVTLASFRCVYVNERAGS